MSCIKTLVSFSRSKIKSLIEGKHLKVDGLIVNNPSFKVQNCEKPEAKVNESSKLLKSDKVTVAYHEAITFLAEAN